MVKLIWVLSPFCITTCFHCGQESHDRCCCACACGFQGMGGCILNVTKLTKFVNLLTFDWKYAFQFKEIHWHKQCIPFSQKTKWGCIMCCNCCKPAVMYTFAKFLATAFALSELKSISHCLVWYHLLECGCRWCHFVSDRTRN